MSYRYAKQPSPPRSPKPGSVWLDTDTGRKWRFREGRGWVKFRQKRSSESRADWTKAELKILREVYPTGNAEGVHERLPRRSLMGIRMRAHKLGIKGPLPPPAFRTKLWGPQLQAATDRFEAKESVEAIARDLGIEAPAARNAIYMELGRRRGHKGAERDKNGHLTEKGVQQLRELLRKGWTNAEIQIRLIVSACLVSHERRRYSAFLKANRKAPLPPPGGGRQYSGVRVGRAKIKEVHELLMTGLGTPRVSERTGVSTSHCQRQRKKLIARLRRKGECLPGCDRDGRRLRVFGAVSSIPTGTRERFEQLLLVDRLTVKRAAERCVVGGSQAYRWRDELKARLTEQGLELPPPLPWRGRQRQRARAVETWLPAGRSNIILYRRFLREQGGDEEEARRLTLRAIAERDGGDPALAEMVDRVRRGARAVPKVVLSAAPPDMTLGGVASGMCV